MLFHFICYQESKRGLTTVWKIKTKIFIEKQPVRGIRGNSCVLKEAATASYSWKINVPQILLT